MVLATTSNEIPEAALVGFYSKENLEIIFGTESTSRKVQNIQNNSRVAGVVSTDEISVQFEGIVSIIIGNEIAEDKEKFFAKIPSAKEYESDPNQIYFKIMPIWFRYVDYSKNAPEIFEIRP